MKRVAYILFTLLSITGSALAATPTIEATLKPDSVGIGDIFTYSITVERDQVQVIGFPEFSTKEGDPIELVESVAVDTLEIEGRRVRLRKDFKLRSFEAGIINLGRAEVLYLDKNITDTLHSRDSLFVEVHTFQIDSTSQAIYDLKPQREMPFKFAEVRGYTLWSLLSILLIIVAIWVLQHYLSKRGKRLADLFKPAPLPPAHVEAIKALEELQNQKLWQNQKFKEYYSSLTHIVRHYIARRYEVAAMEMTSDEIIEAMRTIDLPSKSRMDLTSLLREADLVKFAKATPESSENEDNYFKVYYFVEETKIQEEESTDNEAPTEKK